MFISDSDNFAIYEGTTESRNDKVEAIIYSSTNLNHDVNSIILGYVDYYTHSKRNNRINKIKLSDREDRLLKIYKSLKTFNHKLQKLHSHFRNDVILSLNSNLTFHKMMRTTMIADEVTSFYCDIQRLINLPILPNLKSICKLDKKDPQIIMMFLSHLKLFDEYPTYQHYCLTGQFHETLFTLKNRL